MEELYFHASTTGGIFISFLLSSFKVKMALKAYFTQILNDPFQKEKRQKASMIKAFLTYETVHCKTEKNEVNHVKLK